MRSATLAGRSLCDRTSHPGLDDAGLHPIRLISGGHRPLKPDPRAEKYQQQIRALCLKRGAQLKRLEGILTRAVNMVGFQPRYPIPHSCGFKRRANIEALERMDRSIRLATARALFGVPIVDNKLSRNASSLLTKACYFLERDEKLAICRELLSISDRATRRDTAAQLISLVLSSSTSSSEHAFLVKRLGTSALLGLKHSRLANHVARVIIRTRHLHPPLPRRLSKYATAKPTTRKLNELRDTLQAHLASLENDGQTSHCVLGRRYQKIIRNNLEYLSRRRRSLRTTRQRRTFVNTLLKKIEIEYKTGIQFGQNRDARASSQRHWSAAELDSILRTLRKIPFAHLHFTTRLTTVLREKKMILRGKELDEVYAERVGNTGHVRMFDDAFNDEYARKLFSGVDSATSTFAHEVAHSIHFARFGDGRKRKESTQEVKLRTNPRIDFADFVRLSNWKVIDPSTWSIVYKNVEEDGETYTVAFARFETGDVQTDVPVRFQGEPRILSYSQGVATLFSRDPQAQFTKNKYSETDPWEDYAESFSEYLHLPGRLIEHAPLKFLYLEQEFRRYHADERIQEKLAAALREAPSTSDSRRRKTHLTKEQKNAA